MVSSQVSPIFFDCMKKSRSGYKAGDEADLSVLIESMTCGQLWLACSDYDNTPTASGDNITWML